MDTTDETEIKLPFETVEVPGSVEEDKQAALHALTTPAPAPTPTASPAPQPAPGPPKVPDHAHPAPVMDIRPPHTEPAKPASADAIHEAPKEDAKPADSKDAKDQDKGKHDKPAKVEKPKVVKPPRQPGVGLAIFATVVIVLGLAALATYAYLKTQP